MKGNSQEDWEQSMCYDFSLFYTCADFTGVCHITSSKNNCNIIMKQSNFDKCLPRCHAKGWNPYQLLCRNHQEEPTCPPSWCYGWFHWDRNRSSLYHPWHLVSDICTLTCWLLVSFSWRCITCSLSFISNHNIAFLLAAVSQDKNWRQGIFGEPFLTLPSEEWAEQFLKKAAQTVIADERHFHLIQVNWQSFYLCYLHARPQLENSSYANLFLRPLWITVWLEVRYMRCE